MNSNDNNAAYRVISKIYDLFDLIFILGGKGNPRSGLLEEISENDHKILEICIGTASNSIVIAKKYIKSRIIGIDISPEMLFKAEEKIKYQGISNIQLSEMSADNLKFEDGFFDVSLISFALHEMERELRKRIYKEVSRILRPNGRFIIIDFAIQRSLWNRIFINLWTIIEPSTFIPFIQTDWRQELNEFGMELITVREYSYSNVYTFQRK